MPKTDAENFIATYCEIIDQCHGQRPDKFWLATWMSSKAPYFDFPKNFEHFWLTEQLPAKSTLLKKTGFALRQIVTLCSVLVKSTYLKIILRNELKELSKLKTQEINLVRTFLYKSDPKAKDPFWGDLMDLLTQGERPVVTIYDPLFPLSGCKQVCSRERRNFPYLVFVSPISLIKSYFLLIFEAFKKINFEGDYTVNGLDIQNFIVDSYQNELLSPSCFINLVFMNSFKNFLKKYQVHKAYLTFENNPWEKMFYLARAATNQVTQVIGFQHSSIQEAATNYRLSAYEAQHHLCPDKIMSVGEFTYQLMKDSTHYKNIAIEAGCALRYNYLEKIDLSVSTKTSDKIHLLVILDGIPGTVNLIELVLNFVKLNELENVSTLIREHPSFLLQNFMPEFLTNENVLNKKINLSTDTLQKNLEWSDLIIYTGSTICIEALKMGKAVINYNYTLFNYDPLFQFTDFKWKANTPQDLKDIIINFSKLSSEDLMHKKLAAKKFVSNYFSPCTRENIKRFL